MLRKGNDLAGARLVAQDGPVGSVKEFYFDDDTWTVRYIVVDAGSWLAGRWVLISPASVTGIDDGTRVISVGLSRDRVQHSPPAETDKPVSRRYEDLFNEYYRLSPYWLGPGRWGGGAYPSVLAAPGIEQVGTPEVEPGDPHLRSSSELRKYSLQAKDGKAGEVEDFLLDDRTWAVRYVVVDTREWWPGGKVLVSPLWVAKISWERDRIVTGLPRRVIREAPRYDPSLPVTEDYERRLFRYYGSEEAFDLVRLKHPSRA